MIIYLSMILWPLLIYYVYSLNHKEEIMLTDYNLKQGIQNKIPWMYAIIVFGYFIFWIGIRNGVGDTTAYMYMFDSVSPDFNTAWSEIDWEGKGPGFEILSVIFKCFISQDPQWWIMTIAIISGVCILIVLHNYSIDYFYSCFLFISMITFVWMMNGIRQFIAVSILFLCCNWIVKGKFIKFIIAVLLMCTIHTTAILMIPLFFIARIKPWSGKIYAFIAAMILLCIFSEPFFNGLDSVLSDTAYSGSTAQFADDDGVNPIRVVFYAVIPTMVFLRRDRFVPYYEKFPILPICINMSLITAALYLVGMFTSGLLIGRFPIYSEVYNLILIPFVFKIAFDKEEQQIAKPVYTIILFAFFYLQERGLTYTSELTGFIN